MAESEFVPSIEEAWQETWEALRSNPLLNSPAGKSLFAHGASIVLERLNSDFNRLEWQRIYDELHAFEAAYMEQSKP